MPAVSLWMCGRGASTVGSLDCGPAGELRQTVYGALVPRSLRGSATTFVVFDCILQVYYCCWMWPVNGWADGPWWGAPSGRGGGGRSWSCQGNVRQASHAARVLQASQKLAGTSSFMCDLICRCARRRCTDAAAPTAPLLPPRPQCCPLLPPSQCCNAATTLRLNSAARLPRPTACSVAPLQQRGQHVAGGKALHPAALPLLGPPRRARPHLAHQPRRGSLLHAHRWVDGLVDDRRGRP